MEDIKKSVIENFSEAGYSADYVITADEVVEAVTRLKSNKNDGGGGLSTNHFKFACVELAVRVSCLFSSILVHGTMLDDLLKCTAIPIPKGKNVNVTESSRVK